MIVSIELVAVVAVFRVIIKGEHGVKSVGLVDKGVTLNAPYKGVKSSLLAMVSLEYS